MPRRIAEMPSALRAPAATPISDRKSPTSWWSGRLVGPSLLARGPSNTISRLADALFGFTAEQLQANVSFAAADLGRTNQVDRWSKERRSEAYTYLGESPVFAR